MRKFNKDYEANMKVYRELRNDNDNFSYKYRIAKEKNPNFKKTDDTQKFQLTFYDLIANYKSKGVKVPNLSLKNKLFEISPLLMDNSNIVRQFPIGDNKKIYEKDLNFLDNLNDVVNEKITRDENKFSYLIDEKSIKNSIKNQKIDENLNIKNEKTNQELIKEIEVIKEQINKSKSMIDMGEHKKIFDLKGIIQLIKDIKLWETTQNLFLEKKTITSSGSVVQPSNSVRGVENIRNLKKNIEIKNSLNKESIQCHNEKNLPKISFKSNRNPNDTGRLRDLSTINSSIYTDKSKTMRNFFSSRVSRISKNQISKIKRSTLNNINNDQEREREEILNNIEGAIGTKFKEFEDINCVYDKIIGKDDVKNIIVDYYVKNGKDRDLIEENFNK